MKALILARGTGDRWTSGIARHPELAGSVPPLKHMLQVSGETIIERTVRLLIEAGFDDLTAVVPKALLGLNWRECKALDEGPNQPGEVLFGLFDSIHVWSNRDERVAVLLGDVVFSRKCIQKVVDCIQNVDIPRVVFLGRPGKNLVTGKPPPEIFGLVADDLITKYLNGLIRMYRTIPYVNWGFQPKLWALYREYCGFLYTEEKFEDRVLWNPNDYTDDVDSIEEFISFWPTLRDSAEADKEAG